MRIIPAIDLKGGLCVRLLQGDFDKVTEYSSNPVALGERFSALDVEELHIVDLDGARTGAQENQGIVREIAQATGLRVQLGGGIRTAEHVVSWLSNSVTRCVVGSVAINEPATVKSWIEDFGSDAIVLALDVKLSVDGTPMLTTQGWTEDTETSLWECIDAYGSAGIRHVLCTDVARDGAMSGPNFRLYAEILQRYPTLQLQASGGVRDIDDLELLREIGAPAAITGRALLDGAITEAEVATFQRSA